jgi:HSP20 family protein
MRVQRGKIARELAQIEEQMDRAFERAFATTSARLAGAVDAWRPALDVLETERGVVLRVDLAGVSSDEVRVVVDGEYVQISGRRTLSRAGQNQRHLLIELPQGPFERVLRMRAPYDADAVTARLENGILIVELPRVEGRSRTIQVRS